MANSTQEEQDDTYHLHILEKALSFHQSLPETHFRIRDGTPSRRKRCRQLPANRCLFRFDLCFPCVQYAILLLLHL